MAHREWRAIFEQCYEPTNLALTKDGESKSPLDHPFKPLDGEDYCIHRDNELGLDCAQPEGLHAEVAK